MNILGINAFHENSSAAIVCDGKLIAAAEEERFNRVKYAAGFPSAAIRFCLKEAGLDLRDIHHVAIPRNPYARLIKKFLYAMRMPTFARHRMHSNARFTTIPEALAHAFDASPYEIKAKFHNIEHHQAHLASSFFVSPFERAAVFSADGLGDFASTMWGVGEGQELRIKGSVAFPHSLGIYYNAVTQYLGFVKFGEEFKVMGLSAYGEPEQLEAFREILRFDAHGKGLPFRLSLDYFCHHHERMEMTWADGSKTPTRRRMFSAKLQHRFGPARLPEEPIDQKQRNLAASLQTRLEEVYLGLLRRVQEQTGEKAVCLSGGVALNCVANGKIFEETAFEKVYIPPAAGDAGLAVGAAMWVNHQFLGRPRSFKMEHAYWGPSFPSGELRSALKAISNGNGAFDIAELADNEVSRRAASLLAKGQILGWFQGRMEWGPRALGNRSILVDPRRAEMKEILNRRVKHRESFRPFAPSILAEAANHWFQKSHPSPFMLMAYSVRPEKRAAIPAPTHVDGTGRLQTVTQEVNPRYWRLIKEFESQTGIPVLLNTSFNDNEPIVCTPGEAVDCFRRTHMDALVMGNFLVTKKPIPTECEMRNPEEALHPKPA